MRPSTLAAASTVYKCATIARVARTRLSHERFRAYSLSLRRLIRGVGENGSDEAWKAVLSPLRRYGFSLCAAPLAFNEGSIRPDLDRLRSRLEGFALVYPAQAILLAKVLDDLEALISSCENPMVFWLSQNAVQYDAPGAVLIRDSRLLGISERQLLGHPATRHLEVVAPAQLTRDKCFNVLYVLGAARWFPSFVLEAPRANAIELVTYSWIRDKREPGKTFLNSSAPDIDAELEFADQDSSDVADDVLPVVDWIGIGQRVASTSIQNPLDSVDAKLFLLDGEQAVFLEAADGASVLSIDLDADETTDRIARIGTNEVRSGTFLLLRTSGSGDYIVTEADRHFLRSRAPELRSAQRQWKELLRKEVQASGLLVVSLKLIDFGSHSADEVNVRNYLSPRSIRTRSTEDFRAIMRLIGLGDEWERYWNMMGEIDQAHRYAGHRIRKQLLHRLEQLDLTELERTGRLNINLPDMDGGGLAAFRVVDVSPNSQLVSNHQLGHPFEL